MIQNPHRMSDRSEAVIGLDKGIDQSWPSGSF